MAPKDKPSQRQVTAARRVDRLATEGTGNDRYEKSMYGYGSKATGSVEPMRKVANARSIAYDADRTDYLNTGGKSTPNTNRRIAAEATKRIKRLDRS